MTEHKVIFSKFWNTPEDTFSIYCQSLNVWIQQSQSETNGLMSAVPAFDPSDRWLALSLSIANLASRKEPTREDTRVSAFALRLLSVWIQARPHSDDLLSREDRPFSPGFDPYMVPPRYLALFWILAAITKSQFQQLFCHRSLSRIVFPPRRRQEKVDYWSRAGPVGLRSHFPGHPSS